MRRTVAALVTVLVALLAYGVAPSAADAGPTITVTPTTGITDYSTGKVTGTGWSSLVAGIELCTTTDFNAAPPSGDVRFDYLMSHCDLLAVGSGTNFTTYVLFQRLQFHELSCGISPGDCVVTAMGEPGSNQFSNAVPVTFATPPKPTCILKSLTSTGITIAIHALNGLQSIAVTTANNANVVVPPFAVGTKDLTVSATKIDTAARAQVALRVRSTVGATTDCDPILTTVTGGEPAQRFTSVAAAEHFVRIDNHAPGLRHVTVAVGHRHRRIAIEAGASTVIDFGGLLPHGATTYTLRLRGAGRGAADVLVWDGASSQTASSSVPARFTTG